MDNVFAPDTHNTNILFNHRTYQPDILNISQTSPPWWIKKNSNTNGKDTEITNADTTASQKISGQSHTKSATDICIAAPLGKGSSNTQPVTVNDQFIQSAGALSQTKE